MRHYLTKLGLLLLSASLMAQQQNPNQIKGTAVVQTPPTGVSQNIVETGGARLFYNGSEVATIASSTGFVNVLSYCIPLGIKNQTCLENAIAANAGQTLYVPAGSYSGTSSTINSSDVHVIIDPNANLNYVISMNGPGFTKTNTVNIAANPTAGTTSFAGNFSAYSPGQIIVIEQVVNNGQVPVDFATVQTASGTSLTITSGIRFSYQTPSISKVSNVAQFIGTLAYKSQTISGNYTAQFSAGDIIRIENISGTDNPVSNTEYFEYARIGSIDASKITLETGLHSSFGNPWLAKVTTLANVSFEGYGYIKQLGMTNVSNLRESGLHTDTSINQYIYDAQFTNLRGTTTGPVAFYMTFMWNATVSNTLTKGGVAITDNGNFKALGIQGVSIGNISTWQGTDAVEGEYPLMVDFNYTPYSIWNANNTISSASVGSSIANGGASVFLGGFRNSSIAGMSNMGNVTMLGNSGLNISSLNTTGQILIQSGNAYHINNFTADSLAIGQVSAVSNSEFSNFTIAGGATENGGSAINILGGSNDRFIHGEFTQSDLTFFTVNAQAASSNMYYEDLQDYAGTNLTFSLHTDGTGSHTITGNRFVSTVQGPFLPIKQSSGVQVSNGLVVGGGATISNTSDVPQVGSPTVGQAACIKAAGPPVIIGYCSTVVSAGGACTCN